MVRHRSLYGFGLCVQVWRWLWLLLYYMKCSGLIRCIALNKKKKTSWLLFFYHSGVQLLSNSRGSLSVLFSDMLVLWIFSIPSRFPPDLSRRLWFWYVYRKPMWNCLFPSHFGLSGSVMFTCTDFGDYSLSLIFVVDVPVFFSFPFFFWLLNSIWFLFLVKGNGTCSNFHAFTVWETLVIDPNHCCQQIHKMKKVVMNLFFSLSGR